MVVRGRRDIFIVTKIYVAPGIVFVFCVFFFGSSYFLLFFIAFDFVQKSYSKGRTGKEKQAPSIGRTHEIFQNSPPDYFSFSPRVVIFIFSHIFSFFCFY